MIYAALLSSLSAVYVHFYLILQHYQLKLGLAEGKSACNISSTFNCDSVAISSYSVFLGIPMATWGLMTNVVLVTLIFLALVKLTTNSERVLRYSYYLNIFVALTSVVMFFISSYFLKTYCLYCMAAYFLSFMGCFFLFKITKLNTQEFLADLKSVFADHKWILGALSAIPVGAFLISAIFANNYGLDKLKLIVIESIDQWQNSPQQNFQLENGLIYQKGSVEPKMTIVEFADFKCPHCKTAAPTLHAFAESRPDVRIVFKPFPLDGTCNQAIDSKGDGSRCKLAYAVLCAEKISKKGWEVHNWIFDKQDSFLRMGSPDQLLEQAAVETNVPVDQIKSCMQSNEIQDLVLQMTNEGKIAQIRGTPSVFANGRSLERGNFLPVLEEAYSRLNK